MNIPILHVKLSTQGRLLVGIPLLCELIFVSVLLIGQTQLERENSREDKTRQLLLSVNNELRHMVQLGTAIGLEHLTHTKAATGEINGIKEALMADRKGLNQLSQSEGEESIIEFDRSVGNLLEQTQQIESMSFSGDRLDALRGLMSIERLVKKITAEGEQIAAKQNERVASFQKSQDRLRKVLNILIVLGVISSTLLAIFLAEWFRRQTADRLSVLFKNSRNIAADLPLETPLQGLDELKEIDASIHSMFEDLKRARIRERSILDNAGELICELSTSGEVLRINLHGETILKSKEVQGKNLSSFLSATSKIEFAETMASFATGRSTEAHIDLEIHSDEHLDFTEWSLQKLKSENLIVCVARDVTERKRLEALRQDVVQMVSHDLRSPLNGLQLLLNVLGSGSLGALSDKGLLRIAQANEATKFMLSLIDQLLSAEKLRAKSVSAVTFSYKNLKSIIETAVNDVAPTAESRQLEIRCKLVSMEIDCDEHLIRRVLQNVLYNAIKYSLPKGQINVDMAMEENVVSVSVTDQGKGFPLSTGDKLFEKFAQGESEIGDGGGFGLGLAFCKAAVEAHKGTIEIEPMQSGTRVLICLPRKH